MSISRNAWVRAGKPNGYENEPCLWVLDEIGKNKYGPTPHIRAQSLRCRFDGSTVICAGCREQKDLTSKKLSGSL